MKIWISAAPFACGLIAAAAAAAPVNYDCDTNAGSFSAIDQVQAGPAYHVRGAITPMQWRTDERWMPSAQIRLSNADGSRAIAIKLVRTPGRERADYGVETRQGGPPNTVILGNAGLNEAVAFDLSVLVSGDTVVTLGSQRRVFHLDLGRNAKISVTCSTGEFSFGDLDWGD